MASLAFSYRLGESTVSNAIKDTCDIINLRMVGTCIPPPTEDEWRGIAARFMERWNFPNCIGALDGKHVSIQAPPGSGTLYCNDKRTFSVVLWPWWTQTTVLGWSTSGHMVGPVMGECWLHLHWAAVWRLQPSMALRMQSYLLLNFWVTCRSR